MYFSPSLSNHSFSVTYESSPFQVPAVFSESRPSSLFSFRREFFLDDFLQFRRLDVQLTSKFRFLQLQICFQMPAKHFFNYFLSKSNSAFKTIVFGLSGFSFSFYFLFFLSFFFLFSTSSSSHIQTSSSFSSFHL